MGTIKTDVFDFNEETNYLVTIKFDKFGFYINDYLITRADFIAVEDGKTPEIPNNPSGIGNDVWTYPNYFMPHFQNTANLSFGSMEGSTRSYAYYEYIKYHHNLN